MPQFNKSLNGPDIRGLFAAGTKCNERQMRIGSMRRQPLSCRIHKPRRDGKKRLAQIRFNRDIDSSQAQPLKVKPSFMRNPRGQPIAIDRVEHSAREFVEANFAGIPQARKNSVSRLILTIDLSLGTR